MQMQTRDEYVASTMPAQAYIPYVIEEAKGGREKAYDIYSRLMKDRIIFIGTGINHHVANAVMAQILFLNLQSSKAPIKMYINSPGGVVTDGLAILDVMSFVPNRIETYCIGQCASMGAVLLAAGTKGHRYALPHSRVMIHQPWGGAQGTASDMAIQVEEITKLKEELNRLLADFAGKSYEEMVAATDRDNFMKALEAKEFGLIDHVIEPKEVEEDLDGPDEDSEIDPEDEEDLDVDGDDEDDED